VTRSALPAAFRHLVAGAAVCAWLAFGVDASAAPPAKSKTPNGLSLRLTPLIGKVDVQGHYQLEDSDLNSATYLEFRERQSVTAYGAALRAGWAWRQHSALVMFGLGYTLARGESELKQSTARGSHALTLRPAYDSVGVVIDVVMAQGYAGFECFVGTGRVASRPTGSFDVATAGERNGYLLGVGLRARMPRDSLIAGSLGFSYEVLGLAPRFLSSEPWTNGHLLSLRAGVEFDMALAGANSP
jgi:hypothetical protein